MSSQPNWAVMDLTDKIRELFENSKESKANIDYDIRRLIETYVDTVWREAYESGYEAGYTYCADVMGD